MEFLLGEDTVVASSGEFVYSPKGQFHTWKNTGSIPAKVLFFFTPAGIERLFDEIGVPVEGPVPWNRLLSNTWKNFTRLAKGTVSKLSSNPRRPWLSRESGRFRGSDSREYVWAWVNCLHA
jgi:hypothetical protein